MSFMHKYREKPKHSMPYYISFLPTKSAHVPLFVFSNESMINTLLRLGCDSCLTKLEAKSPIRHMDLQLKRVLDQ